MRLTMLARQSLVLGWACMVACGKDVQVGVGPDAFKPLDVPPVDGASVFVTGTYALSFLGPFEAFCQGSLVGSEPSFAMLTPAAVQLAEGEVTLAMPSPGVLTIAGPSISAGFGQDSVNLVLNPNPVPGLPEQPPTIWDTLVKRDFGTGPVGTLHTGRYIGVDSATAENPAMEAAVALQYVTPDMADQCFAVLRAVLASQ